MNRTRTARLTAAAVLALVLAGCPLNDDMSCSNHPNEVDLGGGRCQHDDGAGFVNHAAPCAVGC